MIGVETIRGLDFSAANDDAGEKTWIAEADCSGGTLMYTSVETVCNVLDCPSDRQATFRALRRDIARSDNEIAYGFDFPFSLPGSIVVEDEWLSFLENFPTHFSGPDDFRMMCHRWTQLIDSEFKELKRACEKEYGALCAYNLRLFKMTYYGIQDLLRPLRLSETIWVQPFDADNEGRPVVGETYPAATLQKLGIDDVDYKGESGNQAGRSELLEAVRERKDVELLLNESTEQRIVSDDGGDALDSILAAYGLFRGRQEFGAAENGTEQRAIEGHIFA